MAINKLTDIQIKKAKPKEKPYTLSDGKGLHILIKPNGSKLWEFVYTSPTRRKRRKTSLGTYPQTSLQTARQIRDEYANLIAEGKDPIDEKRKRQREAKYQDRSLFANVANEWLKRQQSKLKGVTFEKKSNLFHKFVIPFFKDRQIDTITHHEIILLIEEKAKTAPETASRLLGYLDNLFRYAMMMGYCDHNIIANIHKESIIQKPQRKSYDKITDLNIFKELINAIYNDTKMHYSTRNALKFVLHIPLRAENLTGLRWEYIDFDNRILTIPRRLMKIKNPNLPDFKVPLTDEVIAILTEQRELTGGFDFIFIGERGKPINKESPNRALQRLGFGNAEAGRKQTLHSFRGTFRSLAETYEPEHGIPEKIQEIALDHHEKSSVVLAYKHKADYTRQLKKLMEWWSDFILRLKDNPI